MTSNMKSRLADLQVVGAVIAITAALAAGSWKVVDVLSSKEDRIEHAADIRIVHERIGKVKETADGASSEVHNVQQIIGRDVKTIKCILTAPSRKAKGNCGL